MNDCPGEDAKVAELNGSASACVQAAVGVLSKLHHVDGPVQVQASLHPHADGAEAILAQCKSLVANSPVLDGAVTASLLQDTESGTSPADRFSVLLLSGDVQAVLATTHRIAEAIWGVVDAFGIAIMCAEIPAGRVAGLIGKGGANAKHLRGMGVDFDVPRDRPQIGNCTIQFSMPASARKAACADVQNFVGSDTSVVWRSVSLPLAELDGTPVGDGTPSAAGGELDAASATDALQDACRAAVGRLVSQMQSPERPSPDDIAAALQEHRDGITVQTLGLLQRGIFACYQAAFGVGLGHVAHGQDAGASEAALQWLNASLQVVQTHALEAMQSPLVASTLHQSGAVAALNSSSECLFFPSPSAHARLLQVLRRAHTSLDVAVFSITDNDIADTLVAAMKRGVTVRIISDDEQVKQQGSDILRLQSAGIPVKVDMSPAFHMHHKYVIIDSTVVATGSYNWTQQAHTGNHENLLLLEDTGAVRQYQKSFQGMWDSFQAPHA